MKNLFMLFLFSIISASFLYSQNGNNCEMTKDQFDEIYNTIGKAHNEALDKVLISLTNYEGKESKTINAATFHEFVVNATSIPSPYNDVTKNLYLKDADELLIGLEISPSLQTAIDKTMNLLKKGYTPDVLNQKFDKFYNFYLPKISDCNEKRVFTSMLSIGKNSYEYWTENFEEWEDLGGDVVAARDIDGLRDTMVAADITGGIIGGIFGGPPGILTGAAIASARAGVVYVALWIIFG